MKLIFCVDTRGGITFFGKRQSKDAALREFLLNYIGDAPLFMSDYSAKQFEPHPNIKVCKDYAQKAAKNDYCFIEDGSYPTKNVTELVVCNWNREYPADKYLDISAFNLKKQKQIEILGKSHKKITIDIYF